MNQDINEALNELINEINQTEVLNNIKALKTEIKNKPELINKINNLSNAKDKYELISNRKDLYENKLIKELQISINELNLILLNLNKKLNTLSPNPVCKKDT